MKTTKKWSKMLLSGMFGMALAFGLVVMGCSSTPKGDAREPGPNESVILIQRKGGLVGAGAPMGIFLDDHVTQLQEEGTGTPDYQIKNGQTLRLVVPNGKHVLYATWRLIEGLSSDNNINIGEPTIIELNSEEVFFTISSKTDHISGGKAYYSIPFNKAKRK
ncbi:hypothetical protein AGMMS49944_06160 [Spirochaetia bacterium]|nr:hypothetical protein AGMMS49944_06160 [Spirochaetia bacterium]